MTKKIKRGRPAKFDRQKAIEVAKSLFHARGYEGVGVAELGQAMGIKPPSLYAAFGSKHQLYELALTDYASSCGAWLVQALSKKGPITEVIEALFETAAMQYTTLPESPGCLILNGARNTTQTEASQLARMQCADTRALVTSRIAEQCPNTKEQLADCVMLVLHGLSSGAAAGWTREKVVSAAKGAAIGFAAQAKIDGQQ